MLRIAFWAVLAMVVLYWLVQDIRKGADEGQRMRVVAGIRKLRERAEAMQPRETPSEELQGYRSAIVQTGIEARPGFIARMRARHRAHQQIAMERRLSRRFR